MLKSRKCAYFFIGFVAGIIMMISVSAYFVYHVKETGLKITLNVDEFVIPAICKLEDIYKAEINSSLNSVKKNIPQIARKTLKLRKSDNNANLSISGFNIVLPNAFVEEFEGKILNIVESALYELIESIQKSGYMEELSANQPTIIAEFIKKEFRTQKVKLKLPGGINIPVNIGFE
ncbi:MAG TPA: hypothetical protein GX526_06150 [Thermoanaerobacterales bacterium]|nr:hypothetical protein [Thermoanaerobacterales bacterium]